MRRINIVLEKLKCDGVWLTIVSIQQYFSRRLAYKKMLQRETLQERFSEIYEKIFGVVTNLVVARVLKLNTLNL